MLELDIAILIGALGGLFLLVLGTSSLGNRMGFRVFTLIWALVMTALYATQTAVSEVPMNGMGFPLLGIVCWGIISFLQVLQIRSTQRQQAFNKRWEEHENQIRQDDGDLRV